MKTLSTVFNIATYIALSGWVVLIAFPNWQFGEIYVVSIASALVSILYAYMLFFGTQYDEGAKIKGNFMTLEGVVNLFKTPRAVLIGWIHYLAFDVIIGLFILKNAQHYGISHWLVVPCLILTLMVGPVGLLSYLLLRFFITHDYLSANFF
jgi:Co/Zn/Cd efflux system component